MFGSTNDNKPGPDLPAGIKHLAIIMDGNGRWAKKRFLPRIEGHRQGAKTVRMLVEECRRLGIRYLTLFCFSTENWQRPENEVSGLMQLFIKHLKGEVDLLLRNDIRLRAIGDISRLSQSVQEALCECQAKTADKKGMDLLLAVSYGGREEILNATREIALLAKRGELGESEQAIREKISTDLFSKKLYAPDIPDPDLLIRTSDENRISNFLLWQLAYSEIVVSPVFWPDFDKLELLRCISEYSNRTRRFGLTDEQINAL